MALDNVKVHCGSRAVDYQSRVIEQERNSQQQQPLEHPPAARLAKIRRAVVWTQPAGPAIIPFHSGFLPFPVPPCTMLQQIHWQLLQYLVNHYHYRFIGGSAVVLEMKDFGTISSPKLFIIAVLELSFAE